MKNLNKIILLTVSVLLLGGVLFFAQYSGNLNQLGKSSTVSPTPAPTIKGAVIEEKIMYGGIKANETAYTEYKEGETVLDVLKNTKNIETKQYSFGTSVESIEGVKSGTDGKYWLYYVNDTQAQVGADAYKLKANDKIEWKLEKSQ